MPFPMKFESGIDVMHFMIEGLTFFIPFWMQAKNLCNFYGVCIGVYVCM